VKPYGLEEAPGWCNKLFGKGKRWIAIVALVLALVAVLVWHLRSDEAPTVGERRDRHQIYGDPVLMEEYASGGYVAVFDHPGECLLAHYAQPGVIVPLQQGADDKLSRAQMIRGALAHRVDVRETDCREARELKMIVEGMKDEAREYLADGSGTVESFLKRLDERQRQEADIYERVASELENEQDEVVREAKNDALRALGLRVVPRRPQKRRTFAGEKK